jgi:hypothetical protein
MKPIQIKVTDIRSNDVMGSERVGHRHVNTVEDRGAEVRVRFLDGGVMDICKGPLLIQVLRQEAGE